MGSGTARNLGEHLYRRLALFSTAALLASACGSGSTATPDTLPEPTTTAAAPAGTDGSAVDGGDSSDDATPDTTAPANVAAEPEWATQELILTTIAETDSPVSLVGRSGTGDLYIANKSGTVQRITRTTSKNQPDRFRLESRAVLDISAEVSTGNEQGLLDLVFSSDGRKLYVSYTDAAGANVVDRYNMGSTTVREDSRFQVLRVEQPFPNHNGGGLQFGPDGFLYVGLGDGGRAGDPLGSGQDTSTLLGSILRIDPDGAADGLGYAVPSGNPFVDSTTGEAPEVWLYGVRNPWRFSFDSATDALWIADVGQDQFEEVNRLVDGGRGANLGWNLMEANAPFNGATEPADHVGPYLTYGHDKGRCSVTGGHVYHGRSLPRYEGVYVFGDFCSGEVFGLQDSAGGPVWRKLSLQLGQEQLGSFGVDNDGELYVLNLDGTVNQLGPTPEQVEADRLAAEAARAEAEAEDG